MTIKRFFQIGWKVYALLVAMSVFQVVAPLVYRMVRYNPPPLGGFVVILGYTVILFYAFVRATNGKMGDGNLFLKAIASGVLIWTLNEVLGVECIPGAEIETMLKNWPLMFLAEVLQFVSLFLIIVHLKKTAAKVQ